MIGSLDSSHDPGLKSWVESANDPHSDFPIQNLPLGRFRSSEGIRIGVAIGDQLLDLGEAARSGLLDFPPELLAGSTLVPLHDIRGSLRRSLSELLRAESAGLKGRLEPALRPREAVEMLLPFEVGDYTDFYASVFHATNVGSMFRPDNPLLPNYKYVPVAYHGRASTLVVSGTPIRRPCGQVKPDDAKAPVREPSRLLDYELEIGLFVGKGNPMGEVIPLDHAEAHLFGVCLVNDWSARDIQKWEYQPLGPFLAKSFATSLSPWVVTLEALAPFRCPAYARPEGDPAPLPYLDSQDDRARGGIELTLEVLLQTRAMREQGIEPVRISRGSFRSMYWTAAQMVAHHASNGCSLRPGDLLASGTVSGPEPESRGCLLELSWDGPGRPRRPLQLPSGEKRVFLQDGDEVILRGCCEREGCRRIGLGQCRGIVLPAAL
ncbi:MAG: fumarylacetoacetase [Armatimonadetes bacterium]|nr:fumarylacetoacetase [Armatimonadota bacterium]